MWRQASPFGDLTVVVSEHGVREISLPGDDQPDGEIGKPDRAVARELDAWFGGKRHAFDLELDLDGIDGFRRVALETLAREVHWGETVTYGELAKRAGATQPQAAQDVGVAMARNPVPLIIPCHRVLAAGGKLGGFSAPGSVETKQHMLALEGVYIGHQPRLL